MSPNPTAPKSLRIAVIGMRGLPPRYSGIESAAQYLYPSLATAGHTVIVYSQRLTQRENRTFVANLSQEYTMGISHPSLETLSHSIGSVISLLRERSVDVVHLHALAPAIVLPILKLLHYRTVVTIHGLDWRRKRWEGLGAWILRLAERIAVGMADELIVVSSELKDYFAVKYRRSTELIHNPAVSFTASAGELKRVTDKYDLLPQNYILYSGRLVPEKRIEDIIQAYSRLNTVTPLVIAGRGSHAYTARLHAAANGASNRVLITGFCTHDEILCLTSSALACVLASELEGFPMSALESLALGVPIALSDIAPHRELIADNHGYDLFFRVGSVAEIRDCLGKVITDREAYRQIALDIQRDVLTRFDLDTFVQKTERVLIRAARGAFDVATPQE